MDNLPLVSVVIPAYNAEQKLERLLRSVSAQTYPALEILLCNDGSTDETLKIARAYAEREPRLTVITQENRGVGAARNTCLPRCRGKYIRFADADDTIPETSIEEMVARAERDGAELVIGGFTEYIGEIQRKKNLGGRGDTVACEVLLKQFCWHGNSYFYGVLWNKLFRRDLIERQQNRFNEDQTWGEDFCFVSDYLCGVKTVAYMDSEVYDYRRTPKSASIRQVWDCFIHPLGNIQTKRRMYRHFKNAYIRLGKYPEYRRKLWMYLFRFGIG